MTPPDGAAQAQPRVNDLVPPDAAPAGLTYADLVWVEERVQRWIRFGKPTHQQILDRRTRRVGFAPSTIFAFVRWAAKDRRTVLSRLDILQAVPPSEACSTIPNVSPGAEILLRLSGWDRVRQGLEAIDAVENAGIDPADVAPDWWRHVSSRIVAREPPRPYTRERHQAWLLRREILL